MTTLGIFGPGRAGVGLGLAFVGSGYDVRLYGRRPRDVPAPLSLSWGEVPRGIDEVDVVILAVPDDSLSSVAERLHDQGCITGTQIVLHLSGVLDVSVLNHLRPTGAALGSLHPLQSISDPTEAPQRLVGAAAAVEGDLRAQDVAAELAGAIGLTPVRLKPGSKSRYHAAAVFASNYLVALAATARNIMASTGVTDEVAWKMLVPLMRGTIENMASQGPEVALTGPVVRGDVATVRKHLQELPPEERELYKTLGKTLLKMVRLDEDTNAKLDIEFRGE